ncbi:MAG: putative esterase [Frankiales bacterium]|jgi:1,4-dihydroxy-2-naphthoyl-CoA hydrolase|nr:putative esterase [Frankiales bacterium]
MTEGTTDAATTPSHFDQLIGLKVTELTKDGVTAEFTITPQLQQPYGILHGGVLCTVVESVGSMSGAVWYDGPVVGTSNHTNFIRATREGTLTARSTPIHRGRTQQLWDIDITDEQGRLVAKGQLRLANLDRSDQIGRS